MIFRKIICALKMFLLGFTHSEIFAEQAFISLVKLFEFVMKSAIDDKPYCTHLYLNKNRIVSLWAYPGLSKNPIDRITELLDEIKALKESAQQNLPCPTCEKTTCVCKEMGTP